VKINARSNDGGEIGEKRGAGFLKNCGKEGKGIACPGERTSYLKKAMPEKHPGLDKES